jgi:flagellar basal-body rod protein FlgF
VIEGLRRSAQGVLPRITEQETVANNLANALTPGFKRDRVSFQAVLQQAAGTVSPATSPGGASYATSAISRPDMRPGTVDQTGSPLDLAISGDAYFVVETPAGERYTRAGNFTLNQDGELALPDGPKLLGEGGPISVEGNVTVSSEGEVVSGGQSRGKVRLVSFPEGTQLTHEGATLWATKATPQAAPNATVKQGFLEGSNVNPVEEMVEMLNAYRSYESNLRSMNTQDMSLAQLINGVGKAK